MRLWLRVIISSSTLASLASISVSTTVSTTLARLASIVIIRFRCMWCRIRINRLGK
jgi:hypothetical protein